MTMLSVPVPMRRRAVTPDAFAAIVLVLSGTAGVLSMFLPWLPADPKLPYGSKSGWDLFVIGRSQSLSAGATVAVYSVLAIAVAGGACILLGLLMLTPIDHHPLGAIALLLSVLSIAGAVWWTLDRRSSTVGLSQLLGQMQFGWYAAAAAGVIGVIGSIKALATA